MQKLIFFVADGMGDYPLEVLGNRTPLEVADTPNMDELVRYSIVGRCRTVPHGMPCGSDIANMSLLGYDPVKYYTGRGPIEAVAQKIHCEPEDLIYRMNLCTISSFSSEGVMIDYSAGHIETQKAVELIYKLKDHVKNKDIEFIPGFQYRHLMIQKRGVGGIESKLVINPPHDITNKSIKDDLFLYQKSPILYEVMKEAHEILRNSNNSTKANAIWLWGQGPPVNLVNFEEKFMTKGCVISAVDLIKGLGYASGMDVMEVQGATGLLNTNYEGKSKAVLDFLDKGDFVYLHLEAPDECAHHGDVDGKIKAIENFDKKIIGPLLEYIKKDNIACLVTCDHLTPISIKTHVSDAVPFMFFNPKRPKKSGLTHFTEEAAYNKGDIFIEPGYELISWIMAQLEQG